MDKELEPCPFCKFSKDEWIKHKNTIPSAGNYDTYSPIMEYSRLFGSQVVECQNCGITFILHEKTKTDAINIWNQRG